MGSIALALARAATTVAEAEGMHWRIQRVRSADFAAYGIAHLMAYGDGSDVEPGDEERARAARLAAMVQNPDEVSVAAMQREAIVAAGVVAVSADGVAWEPISIVLDRERADPDASIVHISALSEVAITTLAAAVLTHCQDGGRVQSALAGFRRPA